MDWIQWGTEQQTAQRKAWTPQAFRYVFDSQDPAISVDIADGMVGEDTRDTENFDIRLDVQRRDFIFEVTYLPKVAGQTIYPAQGDSIFWSLNGTELRWSVELIATDDPAWYFHDRHGKEIRVHTQLVDLPNSVVIP